MTSENNPRPWKTVVIMVALVIAAAAIFLVGEQASKSKQAADENSKTPAYQAVEQATEGKEANGLEEGGPIILETPATIKLDN
ncbi:MAG: hypothetical protein QNI91_19105 [Arenicellales bacterium]|nr:hypothetical protein [Arenicellales bacterium]